MQNCGVQTKSSFESCLLNCSQPRVFIAWLVEHCTDIAEVVGLKPVEAISIFQILHFLKSHNTSRLPLKIFHNNCFRFLLGHKDVPREIEDNAYANFFFFWGGGGVKEGFEKVKNCLNKCKDYFNLKEGSGGRGGGWLLTTKSLLWTPSNTGSHVSSPFKNSTVFLLCALCDISLSGSKLTTGMFFTIIF